MASSPSIAVVNTGPLEWAFRDFAGHIAAVLGVPVVDTPVDKFFLLAWDGDVAPPGASFVPFEAVQVAADKRLMAAAFHRHAVPSPEMIPHGDRWLVLEVGTDGAVGHVDRDVGDAALTAAIDIRLAAAFWNWATEGSLAANTGTATAGSESEHDPR